jgi:CRISPR-associated endonuclease Csn1
MAKWRLGLDLGTNSLGWSALGLDENGEINSELIDIGVRIFSDGREPKTGEPLAVARRTAREIRKNLCRRKLRRHQLFNQLQEDNLFPKEKEEAEKIKVFNPYELRVGALDRKLQPFELGRVLFNLGIRRGFKSNRKDSPDESLAQSDDDTQKENKNSDDPFKMKQGEKCLHLEAAIKESGYRTLGEFLWKEHQKSANNENPVGLRFLADRTTYYPLRSLYENEFNAIRAKQEPFYPSIHWEKIYDIIFFQRPLKPQERGKCQFMTDKYRTFKAMPCSQKYRILQEVYNLKWYDELNKPNDLTKDQQDLIIQKLNETKEFSFDKMRRLLKLDTNTRFNLESELRDKLKGNETATILRYKNNFGELWDTLSLEEQDNIVEVLITANEDSEVERMLQKYTTITDEQKKHIVHKTFSSGTTSLCKEITEKLVSIMQEKHLQFDKALILLGYDHFDDSVKHSDLLEYYGKVLIGSTMGAKPEAPENKPELKYGKIANPTVHIALNQLRIVTNTLIKRYGKPSQIVVEVSRDLKASREAKDEIRIANAKRAKENLIINKNITDMSSIIQYPNRLDRQKFRLWQELGAEGMPRRCIYCGKNISASELFSNDIQIEHILPYSRTLLNSESNLTLAHMQCNEKKGEKTPFEAFGTTTSGQYAWEEIMQRVSMLKDKKKQGRFAPDAMEKFEKDASFIDRQLTDNAYLSKIARRYLTSITEKNSDVWTVAGGMTKIMRDKWEIDSILKRKIDSKEAAELGLEDDEIGTFKKNRYDHRHHALDAVVIGLTDRSMVQEIATKNARHQKNRIEMPEMPILRMELCSKVKTIVPSFKPDHGVEGKLSKETLLGRIKLETLVKIADLTADDISNIKVPAVKQQFEKTIAEQQGDLKKTIKILRDTYPEVKVFRFQFVARTSIIGLKDRKNITDIVDKSIRKKLTTFADTHADEKWEQIVQDFSKKTGIKKVRCATFVQTPIIIHPDSKNIHKPTRYLNPVDYFAVIIWQMPKEEKAELLKYVGQFVLRTQVDKNKEPMEKKPHPAAKKICVLYKNDYLEFSNNNLWLKAKIAGFSATANKLDIRPVYSTEDAFTWLISTNETMIEKGWKPQKGQNFVSINVLFGIMSAGKITVDPVGKVHYKK